MTTGAYGKWRKLSNYSKPVLPLFAPYSGSARRSIIDQQTYLLVIPASDQKNIKLVDSLVRADSAILATTENLIIDIRNNLGGTTRTFDALLPYVYTHPIQDVDGLYFSTDRMIGQYQDYVDTLKKQKRDAAQIPLLEDYIRLLKKNKGHFVAPPVVQDRKPIRLDSVRKYPRHVAIVANYACQSAAELMILKFRQSKKVTVFGETTMGVVDYLNFYSSRFPSKKYVLYIPSAKRTPPSGQGLLDGKGIQPDVTIPDQVPDWIGLVKAYYAKKKDIFFLKRNSKAVQE